MTVSQDSVQKINELLDRIVQVKDSPESIQQAVDNVKAKITQLVQDAQQSNPNPSHGQATTGGQHQQAGQKPAPDHKDHR